MLIAGGCDFFFLGQDVVAEDESGDGVLIDFVLTRTRGEGADVDFFAEVEGRAGLVPGGFGGAEPFVVVSLGGIEFEVGTA